MLVRAGLAAAGVGTEVPVNVSTNCCAPVICAWVGTRNVKSEPTRSRWPSYAPKKKVRSLMMGPPSDAPKLLLRNAVFFTGWPFGIDRAVEVVPRVHRAIAQEFKRRSVEVIAAGLRQDIDH